MRQNTLATAFTMARLPQQLLWDSTTMKFNCWADGAVTLTSYTSTTQRHAYYHYHIACIGPFHTVSLTSLHLSSSCLIWLEHGPNQGAQKSGHDNNAYIVQPVTDGCIDERTPPVYVLYARGHVTNLQPIEPEFKPHADGRANFKPHAELVMMT